MQNPVSVVRLMDINTPAPRQAEAVYRVNPAKPPCPVGVTQHNFDHAGLRVVPIVCLCLYSVRVLSHAYL